MSEKWFSRNFVLSISRYSNLHVIYKTVRDIFWALKIHAKDKVNWLIKTLLWI